MTRPAYFLRQLPVHLRAMHTSAASLQKFDWNAHQVRTPAREQVEIFFFFPSWKQHSWRRVSVETTGRPMLLVAAFAGRYAAHDDARALFQVVGERS